MRIGLIIYQSLDTRSGGYLYDRQLVKHLREHGDQVEVITLPWRNYLRHLGDNLSLAWLNRLREIKVDLLLQDELNHPSLFWLNWRLRRSDTTPIVSIVHHLRSSERHPRLLQFLYRWVERRYLQGVDGFVFNSRATRKAVARLLGSIPPGAIAFPAADHLLGNGQRRAIIQAETIHRRATHPGPLRALYVGNLIPRKGLHTLIAALGHIPPGEVQLTVVGRQDVAPRYTQAILRQVASLGREREVTFTSWLEDGALADLMAGSHLLAVPSSYEGFGIVYLEGMGFGLPAIASTAGGAGEIVEDGENGFLIPPGDIAALSENLRLLHHDRRRLAAMGQAALKRYAAHPTWQETTTKIRTYLQDLLETYANT